MMAQDGIVRYERLDKYGESDPYGGLILAQLMHQDLETDAAITRLIAELEVFSLFHPNATLVIDCENVEHASAEFASALMRLQRHVQARGGALEFSSVGKNICELLEVAGLKKLIPVNADLRAALR